MKKILLGIASALLATGLIMHFLGIGGSASTLIMGAWRDHWPAGAFPKATKIAAQAKTRPLRYKRQPQTGASENRSSGLLDFLLVKRNQ